MSAIQSRFIIGDADAGESGFVFQKKLYFGESPKPPLVFCHQHATFAEALWAANVTENGAQFNYYQEMCRWLAEDYTVFVGDLGYVTGQDTWGNATHRARVDSARTYLSNTFGSSGKVTLVGASMGGAGALNYAKYYGSSQVAAVAVCVPLLSMYNLKSNPLFTTKVDGAYGGNYTDAVYGSTFSPFYYKASYPDDTIPTAMWTASDDDTVLPVYADSFLADNTLVSRWNLGAVGHTEIAIAHAIKGVRQDGVTTMTGMVEWLRGQRALVRE